MSRILTLDDFANITRKIVNTAGLDGFLPTFVVDQHIRVIEGIPNDIDQRVALKDMLKDFAGKEIFFAVASGAGEITLGRVGGHSDEFAIMRVAGNGSEITRESRPLWWGRDE